MTQGFISFDQLKIARMEQKRRNIPLEQIVVRMGLVGERVIASIIADGHNLIPFDIEKTVVDTDLLRDFTRQEAEHLYALPLFIDSDVLHAAMVDVYDLKTRDLLKRRFNCRDVRPHPAASSDLGTAINALYDHDFSLEGLLRELESSAIDPSKPGGGQGSVIGFVNAILLYALKHRASDIHFEPEGVFVRIRTRIDGALRPLLTFHQDYWPAVCVRLKMMAELNIAECRKPQSGRFGLFLGGREIDFRLSTHPTIHGENTVIRLLDKLKSLIPLDQLGFRADQIKSLERLMHYPQGILLITGPTGSGKTTTLYSLLKILSADRLNIMTLEEPVEYEIPLLRQCEVKEVGGVSFADGIRSILRQAPDVILVGEIRDEETAKMALRASFTGHLVLATLHTADVFGAIPRLMDLGIPPHLLSGNLTGLVAQRLVRTLCDYCKKPDGAGGMMADGCERCGHQGFHGRTALAELLTIDDDMNDLIAQKASRSQLRALAVSKGFVSLADAAKQKWQDGITTRAELSRCVVMDCV